MNRWLIFAGGGSKGGYAASLALRLAQKGRAYVGYGGESIGAANALLTAVLGPAEVVRLWPTLRAKDIYKGGGPVEQALTVAGMRSGFYDMSPSIATIRRLIGSKRIRDGAQVVVTVTDLATGAMLEHLLTPETPTESCIELVYQSCLVPIAHGARDGRWADGGVSATAPLGPAVRAGAEHVDVILLDRLGIEPWVPTKKAIAQGGRAVEIFRENLFWRDISGTVNRNHLASYGHKGYRRVEATFYDPQGELHDWMDWRPERAVRWSSMTWDEHALDDAHDLMRKRREEALEASKSGGIPGR